MNLIKQYGLERTGTNYLKALIELNIRETRVLSNIFGWKHEKYRMDDLDIKNYDPFKDKNVATDLSKEDIDKFKNKIINGDFYLIVSFKEPYSWIVSYNKCQWLNKGPLTKEKIIKLIDRWNSVNRNWIDTIINNKSNSMGVVYEDLLLTPDKVIHTIADQFNFSVKHNFTDINQYMKPGIDISGTKNIGKNTIDKAKYSKYYKDKIYLKEIEKSLINIITENIDESVLSDIEKLKLSMAYPLDGRIPEKHRAQLG